MIKVQNIVLPNKPLSNFEIEDAVTKSKLRNFCGVHLRDMLPKRLKMQKCGIMNLDDSSGGGTHWVAWFKRGNDKFYFDSFGLPLPTELNNYLDGEVSYPTEQLQLRQEVFCGNLL